ncbi:ABC transporter permease [Spirosoma sp. HMF3257]|uniref:ABC transporter permease n=1 Tax=Spirosoma telluris TaxID=2183553 RepID=A0A327NF57_9BACT|nr:ABC transporter permease [Spirosoma telluris]RAI73852.1 ABC transporter permease [Spirosoma telluris]
MNNCSFCLFLLLGLGLVFPAIAQQSYELTTSQPAQVNGIEYGYTIRNECKKEISNLGTVKRYELTVYATNKSGSTILFTPRQTSFGVRDQDLIARFDCINATGAKLTSKTITLRARPMSTSYTASAKNTNDTDGKAIETNAPGQTGHTFENGETLTNNIVVIVPDGEEPHLRVRLQPRTPSTIR